MIRGVCGHIWEGPGQSAIVLQLNLDRHEEIFTLPLTTSARSPSGRKLKYQPDSSTPIVVRVSVSAPSLEEMPQSVQLWQARGTDERAMAERFAILPRIEIFNNSFCVVTILYRDYGFLLVGMTGNVRKITPNAPCKHNVIVSVEPALSNGKGGEPALHPLTNLNGPAGISNSNNNNISNHYPPLIQSPPQPIRDDYHNNNNNNALPVPSPQRPYDPVHNQKNMESAFVSPQRNAGDNNNNNISNNTSSNNHITAASIGVKKGSNFFHYTRPVAAVLGGGENKNNNDNEMNNNNNTTRQNADSSPTATIIAPKYSVNGVYLLPVNNSGGGIVVAGPNSENNNSNNVNSSPSAIVATPNKVENNNTNNNHHHHIVEISPLSEKVKEDIAALHHRRTDYASVKRKHGFVSPIVPDDLKFKQPPGVNTPAIRVPSYGKNVYADDDDNDDNDDESNRKYSSNNKNNKRASAGPRSTSGVLLVREEQTQTSRSESILVNNNKRNGSTSPPPPPPPFPDRDSPRIVMVSAENNTPFSQSLSVGETFNVFCSRFKEWNEMLEDLALSYSARQTKMFESSFLALVNK